MMLATSLVSGSSPTASPRIKRASSSIDLPLPAARTRKRVFTSSSRLRIVMLANIRPPVVDRQIYPDCDAINRSRDQHAYWGRYQCNRGSFLVLHRPIRFEQRRAFPVPRELAGDDHLRPPAPGIGQCRRRSARQRESATETVRVRGDKHPRRRLDVVPVTDPAPIDDLPVVSLGLATAKPDVVEFKTTCDASDAVCTKDDLPRPSLRARVRARGAASACRRRRGTGGTPGPGGAPAAGARRALRKVAAGCVPRVAAAGRGGHRGAFRAAGGPIVTRDLGGQRRARVCAGRRRTASGIGAPTPGSRARSRKPRLTARCRRCEGEAGAGRAEIIKALSVKGDKCAEQSVSNALAVLKKARGGGAPGSEGSRAICRLP